MRNTHSAPLGERCNAIEIPDGGFREGDNELIVYHNTTDKPNSLLPPFIDIFHSERD